MEKKVSALKQQFQLDLKEIATVQDAEQLRLKYLGKKGAVQLLMQDLRSCSPEDRAFFGKLVNDLKEEVTSLCDQMQVAFEKKEQVARLQQERIDVTLPGRDRFKGKKHPITQIFDRVITVLKGMGFTVQYGPDIDSDYYNFEGLNYPKDHPAREMQDTFYIDSEMLLRSHTSNTQLRAMETHQPPIRIIAPGTVYRNETISARSHVFFHQLEGLYVDKNVSLADLLSTMNEFWSKFFETPIETRFRPSFFPFVEPGLEVDLKCTSCSGKGCRLCKETGWLEVAGMGMVHPEVLKNGGIDPEVYSGYAWGMGIERLTMLLYGIPDIRLLSENDLRFLRQF